jgi:hypothetical protein
MYNQNNYTIIFNIKGFKMKEKVYSVNEDEFYELDEILDLIESDYEPGEITEIYVADKNPILHSNFVDGISIVENITNLVYDNWEEMSDDYCAELEIKEHTKNIENIVLDYLNKNVQQPRFYEALNIKKISLSELKS